MLKLAIAVIIVLAVPASAQVTSNVLGRVLQVRSPAGPCSAFTVEIEEKQYLVTARHCVGGVTETRPLEVRQGTVWKPLRGPMFLPPNKAVDIAAIRLPQPITVTYEFEPTSNGVAIGQPVYFLGYPSDLSTKWKPPDSPDPGEVAFVKAGILSAMDSRDRTAVILYVDGHNNPGFSGGPIVFRPNPTAPFRVAAVVQGFRGEGTPVVKRQELGNINAPAYEDLYARANAGIVVGYSIDNIIEAIRAATKKK